MSGKQYTSVAKGVSRIHKKGALYPFFPPLPLPLPPFPLPSPPPSSFCPSSLPPLPLEVGPHIAARGLGELKRSPSGSGWSPAAKRYLVQFRLKNASGKCNFKYIFTKIHQQI